MMTTLDHAVEEENSRSQFPLEEEEFSNVTSGSPVGHAQWHTLYYYNKKKAREKPGMRRTYFRYFR